MRLSINYLLYKDVHVCVVDIVYVSSEPLDTVE